MVRGLQAVLLVLLLAGCGGADSGGGEEKPLPPASTATPADDLSAKAEQIAGYCRARFHDEFAGVGIDPANPRRLVVYRLSSARLDHAVRHRFGDVALLFRTATATERDLDELTRRVLADRRLWQQQGIDVQGVGPDFVRGTVLVQTPDVDLARSKLPARYGKRIEVQEADIVPAPGSGSG
jgi:hypothetical protein